MRMGAFDSLDVSVRGCILHMSCLSIAKAAAWEYSNWTITFSDRTFDNARNYVWEISLCVVYDSLGRWLRMCLPAACRRNSMR
jgi:hypothetical protein